ncbi:MAG: FecR domain-containing protein [Desulfovibrionaceae bacterium]
MKRFVLLLALLLLCPALSLAAAGEPVGRVQTYEGTVAAVSDGQKRGLALNDPLYANDTVVTGGDGFLQIMFADGTVLTMDAHTEMLLRDVSYTPGNSEGRNFNIDMIAGTCRFVTGQITKHNPEKFKVGSPLGTIGIRGTEGGVLAQAANLAAFNAALSAALAEPGPGWNPSVSPEITRQTVAHFSGSVRKPMSFTDKFGKTVDIGRGQALDVTAEGGAGSPRGVSDQDRRSFSEADFVTSAQVPSPYNSVFSGYDATPGGTAGGVVGGSGNGGDGAAGDAGGGDGHGGW